MISRVFLFYEEFRNESSLPKAKPSSPVVILPKQKQADTLDLKIKMSEEKTRS